MKKLFLLVSILLVSLTSLAGLNKDTFYKAYREYVDRGAQLLPLSNEKMAIEKIVDIGKTAEGHPIYSVYLEISIGLAKYYDAVQVVADKSSGVIDSFNGMFSISPTMIRDKDGNDARFPLKLNEAQYGMLAQKAFEVAKQQYVKTYLDPNYIAKFYIQTGWYNEVDKTFSLEVSSYGLPGHQSQSRMTQVKVDVSSTTGQVLKFRNRDY